MGIQTTISPDVLKIIEVSTARAVKKAVEAIQETHKKDERNRTNYFKECERRLYSLPKLRHKVEQDKLDIEDLEKEGYTSKSKSIVRMPDPNCGIRLEPEEIQAVRISSVKSAMERTQREIDRIEAALDTIRDAEGYQLIELKYFQRKEDEDTIEILHISKPTFYRWKNRLIDDFGISYFGADIFEKEQ